MTPQPEIIEQELIEAIAAVIRDAANCDADFLACLIADALAPLLRQQGWMPPGTAASVHEWGRRLGELPEHHISRSVLNSHLCELWAIL